MGRPILLCHGVCRFDVLWADVPVPAFARAAADRVHYFRGVGTALERAGHTVVRCSVGWADGVDVRARQLGAQIDAALAATGADRVHVVAHSMGGLDTRHLLFAERDRSRVHERVASVTTIGTPHRGSPVADEIVRLLSARRFDVSSVLPSRTRALHDLRTDVCAAFDDHPDVRRFEDALAESVRFRAIAGVFEDERGSLIPRLVLSTTRAAGGPHDGLVPVTSARWRDDAFVGTWDRMDHINLIGRRSRAQARGEPSSSFLGRLHGRYLDIAADLPA